MKSVLAEFETVDALSEGSNRAKDEGFATKDALTPYPLPGTDKIVGSDHPNIRVPMAVGGFGMAVAMFGLEWWSAAYAYPFNEGGRPFFSWQIFLLVPFEVGVLAAGVAGFLAMLVHCGLPRLYHPLFDVGDFERASQDRFFLLFDDPGDEALPRLRNILLEAGALQIAEAAA